MRLGICYNLFDGEELLEASVQTVRSCASYISVTYQDTSNFGYPTKTNMFLFLSGLKQKGLIDEIIRYEPNLSWRGHGNEIAKRNIGLESCAKAGCTHFMSMDCDELYKTSELEYVKYMIKECGYESTACQMQTYYKTAEYAINPPETYFVPLIYKLDERRFNLNVKWPIIADPTRRLEPKKLIAFPRSDIQMHHLSYVRRDIRSKLNNSSANTNWKNRIDEIATHHDNWQPGNKALFAGTEKRLYDVVQVNNNFEINI